MEGDFKGRKVLLTGGLGFIGSNLAARLVEGGAEVTVVDSLIPEYGGKLFNVEPVRDRLHVNISDVRDAYSLQRLVQGKDFLFNLAGQTSHLDSMTDPFPDLDINARAQLSILEACRRYNPEIRIVFASTRQVYGRPDYLPVDESHPVCPVDVNGINKTAGEWYHLLYSNTYGIRGTVLRLTNTYGPRMRIKDARQTFLGIWIRHVLEGRPFEVWDGRQHRDFTYVDDAVDAFLLAAASENAVGKVYNLGGCEVVNLKSVAEMLVAAHGGGEYRLCAFPEERKRIDIGDYYSDDRRIRAELNWAPRVPLEEGLRRTLAFTVNIWRSTFEAMKRRWVINTIVAGLLFLVLLWISDVVIRRRFPLPRKGYGEWAGSPGSSLVLRLEPDGFQAAHRYNRFGFRGADFPIEPAHRYRVLCIGDSFTEGIGAAEDQTWPAVAGRALADLDCEVLNLGAAGSQTDRYAKMLCKVGMALKPTDVVVCIISSDFRYGFDLPVDWTIVDSLGNPFVDNRRSVLKPFAAVFPGWFYGLDRARGRYPFASGTYWPVMREEVILDQALAEIPAWCNVSYWKARALLAERRKDVNPAVIEAVENGAFNPYLLKADLVQLFYTHRATVADMGVSEEDLRACTQRWVAWFARTCAARGVRGWLLYSPLPPLVSNRPFGIYADHVYKRAPAVYGNTSVRDVLSDACRTNQVPLIDATETLRMHDGANEPAFFRWAPHPTPTGYALVGNLVASALRPVMEENASLHGSNMQ